MALLYGGDEAILTGFRAAQQWGLRKVPDDNQIQGSALPRRALAEISAGVRSAAEAWAKALARASGLPEPVWNARLRYVNGRALAVVDAWWDDVGLAWEIDSYAYHLAPKDYERTLRRHAWLTAAGVVVLHTVPGRLRQDRAAVLRELRQSHHQAGLRPRPDVHMATYKTS